MPAIAPCIFCDCNKVSLWYRRSMIQVKVGGSMAMRASVWLMACASACTVSQSDLVTSTAAFGGEHLGQQRQSVGDSASLPDQLWQEDALKENAFTVLLGSRTLDSGFWGPTDEPVVFGLGYAYEGNDEPLGVELGFQFGSDTGSAPVSGLVTADAAANIGNVYFGLRKTFLRDKAVQPFFGAGVELGFTAVEVGLGTGKVKDDDTSAGIYFHGGLLFQVTGSVRFGVDVRVGRGGEVTLFNGDGDLDYEQFGLLMEVLF